MRRFEPFGFLRDLASRWDLVAFVVVIGLIAFLGEAAHGLFAPLSQLDAVPLSLDPRHLPEYAARTTLRMLVALVVSLLFTLTYATWAAKSERAGKLLVPILDILQSVPILGFLSITLVFFMSLAPGRVLGAEFAAVFAIFTSQAWNMAFSFYQSLRTIPIELSEAADIVPAVALDALLAAGGAVRAAGTGLEHDDVDVRRLVLRRRLRGRSASGTRRSRCPASAPISRSPSSEKNLTRWVRRSVTMLLVILLYDQLLFRPLVAWVDRFRVEQDPGGHARVLGPDDDAPLAADPGRQARVPGRGARDRPRLQSGAARTRRRQAAAAQPSTGSPWRWSPSPCRSGLWHIWRDASSRSTRCTRRCTSVRWR